MLFVYGLLLVVGGVKLVLLFNICCWWCMVCDKVCGWLLALCVLLLAVCRLLLVACCVLLIVCGL